MVRDVVKKQVVGQIMVIVPLVCVIHDVGHLQTMAYMYIIWTMVISVYSA